MARGLQLEGLHRIPGQRARPGTSTPYLRRRLSCLWSRGWCPCARGQCLPRAGGKGLPLSRPVSPQTFVNEVRIPDQKYITLKLNDVIRFGYDILSAALPPAPRPKATLAPLSWEQVGASADTAG